MLRELLLAVGDYTVLFIDAVALIVILVGTIHAALAAARALVRPLPDAVRKAAWLRYSRLLSGALTFLLAADIIETSLGKDWRSLVHVAGVAAIRTFLNYFLAKDEAELRAERVGEESAQA
jgi:uncharacterized membrane protein